MENVLTANEIEAIFLKETNRIDMFIKNLDNSLNKSAFKKEKDRFILFYNNLEEVYDCSESLISKKIITNMKFALDKKEYKKLFKLNSLLLIITE
jgi:hypothetical protein